VGRREEKFSQPIDAISIVERSGGPRTLLPQWILEIGRQRVAAGEPLDEVALDLAVYEQSLLEGAEFESPVPRTLGGPGSGNFGHGGRPGEVGGSSSEGGDLADPDLHTDTMSAHFSRTEGWSDERSALHARVINKEVAAVRPASGAPTVYMTGGGPASGKSTMLAAGAVVVPGHEDAVHVDADKMKLTIPEYRKMVAEKDERASSFAHEESSIMAKALSKAAVSQGRDVVLDGTGDSGFESLQNKIEGLRALGAERVVANYASNDVELAVRLARERGDKTGRYVPESYTRSVHAAVSQVLPKAMKEGLFDSVTLWDTNKKGEARRVASAEGKKVTIHDKALWRDFLAKAKA
jgi:zeta toxin